MAHIRKHPVDPTKWQVRYRDPSGRELSKTFTRKSHADQFRIKVEAEALEGRFVDPRAARRTFIEFAKASEPARLNRQATTRARDESVMRSLVLPTFAETPVGRIRTSQVRSWLSSLERAGYSPNTIRKAFQLLARVLEVAVEDRAVPTNPAAAIRDAKLLPTADPDHRFLTTDEIGRLAEAIDPAYRGMVSLAPRQARGSVNSPPSNEPT